MFTNKCLYRPSLATLMTLSQSNYMLLLRLLADKEQAGQVRQFYISEQVSYNLEVREVTRYTSLISIYQNNLPKQVKKPGKVKKVGAKSTKLSDTELAEARLNHILQPKMEIRLYHDAQAIDILASQNIARVQPRYDYPNKSMHQPDEKQQLQLFLKEWLLLCLQQGYEACPVFMQQQVS